MPRIPPSLFWRARRISPCATLLLPACRDLSSSLAELRWIQQHVDAAIRKMKRDGDGGRPRREAAVLRLCRRRGRGEPLQYVLGTQPFGPLEILCRRGVLIPRPEPEAYTMFLADLLLLREAQQQAARSGSCRRSLGSPEAPLRTIVDLCTGTGCIALLLYERLRQRPGQRRQQLRVVGVDVSPEAVALARANRDRLGFPGGAGPDAAGAGAADSSICFHRADIFADDWLHAVRGPADGPIDVLICNPPYVSRDGFAHETARSVRLFEPKLAQVPLDEREEMGEKSEKDEEDVTGHLRRHEDVFYGRLLDLAARLDPRVLLCEVGSLDQARRVVEAVLAGRGGTAADVEIWADSPDITDVQYGRRTVEVAGRDVLVRGSGHGRSVFVRRRE